MSTRLVLVDLVDANQVITLDAAGAGTIVFGPVIPEQLWRVGLINVSTLSVTNTPTALVYVNAVSQQYLRSGTTDGNQDTADQNWPIIVPGTVELFVVWAGGDPGVKAFAGIQYEVLERVAVPGPHAMLGL